MNYITTTQLRTDSTRLISALRSGERISLIHRSQIIGTISPNSKKPIIIQSVKSLQNYLKSISPKFKLTPRKRISSYHRYLKAKYGQVVS